MTAKNIPEKKPPQLRTTGFIAKELSEPLWRVVYIIKTRHIRHVALAGKLRLYDLAAVEAIRQERDAIDKRRRTGLDTA